MFIIFGVRKENIGSLIVVFVVLQVLWGLRSFTIKNQWFWYFPIAGSGSIG